MYKIVLVKKYGNYKKTLTADFDTIKKRVIQILDGRGWDNKENVDFRSLRSCLEYIYEPDYELDKIIRIR